MRPFSPPKEKHYEKIKRKSLYWIIFLLILLAGHAFAFHRLLKDADIEDGAFWIADLLGHAVIYVLDLQFLHFSMVMCKRYRMVNKILVHIAKPWKNYRQEQQPANFVKKILQHRRDVHDQIWDPSNDASDLAKMKDADILERMIHGMGDDDNGPNIISKTEENTFVLQVSIRLFDPQREGQKSLCIIDQLGTLSQKRSP